MTAGGPTPIFREEAKAETVKCPSCGGPIQRTGFGAITTIACSYCGAELTPDEYQETRTVTPARPAGKKFSIRYEEALVLEAAYQRRRADRLETGHAALAARLAAIEAKLA